VRATQLCTGCTVRVLRSAHLPPVGASTLTAQTSVYINPGWYATVVIEVCLQLDLRMRCWSLLGVYENPFKTPVAPILKSSNKN
jgi:hypothetical protein